MKIYILKHKGKNWWGNLMCGEVYEVEINRNKFYSGIYFFRKKDAMVYKNAKKLDNLEIVGCELPLTNNDNRKR